MKKIFPILLFAAFAWPGAASAEDPWRYVAADAGWAVLVRFSEYLDSELGEALSERHRDSDAARRIERARRDYGIDLLGEVDTVLLYGPDGDRDRAVAVILGSFETAGAVGRLEGKESYERFDYAGHLLHLWSEGAVGFPRAGVAVLARTRDALEAALDVMEGRRPRMAPEVLGGPGDGDRAGVFLLAFADPPAMGELAPKAAVFRHADRVHLRLAERSGRLQGGLVLDVADHEAASEIENVVRGLSGYARLQQEDRQPFLSLLRRTAVERIGGRIEVTFEIPVGDLLTGD